MKTLRKIKALVWWVLRTNNSYLVGVFVAVFRGNQIMLIKKRMGITLGWQIPGGGKERGLTPEKAALQELKEETNLVAINMKLAGVLSEEDYRDVRIVYYAIEYSGIPKVNDKIEIAEARFFTIAEAYEMLSEAQLRLLDLALEARWSR